MNRHIIESARLATVATAMAASLAACTSDPATSSAGPPSTTDSSATTLTAPSSSLSVADRAVRDALAAYLAMWSDVADAATTSDWRSPRLARHATGDALSALSRAMYSDYRRGLVAKGEPRHDPSVSTLSPPDDPTTVLISDCGDSTNWLKYDAETGDLADDTPGGRRAITAEVTLAQDGVWKVARFAVEGLGSC